MATASLAFPDTATPTLSVLDPRGLAIRSVAYCRQRPEQTAESRITRQTFDAVGLPVASWDPRLWGMAPKPNLATVYGLSGQPLLTDSVDAGWRLNLPGEADVQCSSWDSRGSQRHTEYDPLQRPVAISEWMAEESSHVVERFAYGDAGEGFAAHNQCGQLVRHDDPAGTRRLADYALNGLPLAENRQFLNSLETPDWPFDFKQRDELLEDGEGFVTAQVYTASGEMQSQTDAQGNIRSFAHTLAGELKDTRLQLAGAGEQPRLLVSAIGYNAFGQVESETAGNGVKTTVEYTAEDGRLIRLLAQVPGSPALQDLHYLYDPVGNILSLEDKSQQIRYFKNQRIDPINRYRYDSLYQLVEATGREVIAPSYGPALPVLQSTPLDPNQLRNYTQTFAYDPAGNLLTRQHSGGPTFRMIASRTSNRSLAQHDDGSLPGEEEITKGFDANGNQQALLRGQTMSWDGRNQLSQVTMVKRDDGPDDHERYIYDRPGHRLRKVRLTQTGSRTLRAEVRYLPGLEIHRDAVTGEKRHVISVDAGRSSVRVLHWETKPPEGISNNQVRYSLSDHLGSSTLELDEKAGLLGLEGYYPFGGTAWWAGSSATVAKYKTIRYSGKERDATGLYYYGYRYYAPWLQRWMSADPAKDINGLNLFAFCGANPVTHSDGSGLYWSELSVAFGYGFIGDLETIGGEFGDDARSVVQNGYDNAIGHLNVVLSELEFTKEEIVPELVLARQHAMDAFGRDVNYDDLIAKLHVMKGRLEFYRENSQYNMLVENSSPGTLLGNALGAPKKLYAGVRIMPLDPYRRMAISIKELNSEGTLDFAFLHAAAIGELGAHEVMPYQRGYPMVAENSLHQTEYELWIGRFDGELASRARKALSKNVLKNYFGTASQLGIEFALGLEPSRRTKFLMNDAGTITSYVVDASTALMRVSNRFDVVDGPATKT